VVKEGIVVWESVGEEDLNDDEIQDPPNAEPDRWPFTPFPIFLFLLSLLSFTFLLNFIIHTMTGVFVIYHSYESYQIFSCIYFACFIISDRMLTSITTMDYTIFGLYREQGLLLISIWLEFIFNTAYIFCDDPTAEILKVTDIVLYTSCCTLLVLHMNFYCSRDSLILLTSFTFYLLRSVMGAYDIWEPHHNRSSIIGSLHEISMLFQMTNWFLLLEKIFVRLKYCHVNVYSNRKVVLTEGFKNSVCVPAFVSLLFSLVCFVLSAMLPFFIFYKNQRKTRLFYFLFTTFHLTFASGWYYLPVRKYIPKGRMMQIRLFVFNVASFQFFFFWHESYYWLMITATAMTYISLYVWIISVNGVEASMASYIWQASYLLFNITCYFEITFGVISDLYGWDKDNGTLAFLWNVSLFFQQKVYVQVIVVCVLKFYDWKRNGFMWQKYSAFQMYALQSRDFNPLVSSKKRLNYRFEEVTIQKKSQSSSRISLKSPLLSDELQAGNTTNRGSLSIVSIPKNNSKNKNSSYNSQASTPDAILIAEDSSRTPQNRLNPTPPPSLVHLDLPGTSNLSSWVPAHIRPSGRRALLPSSLSSAIPENDHFLWSDLESRSHSISTSTPHSVTNSEDNIG